MFDIGWSELLVIAVVALIAIGPKELPGVLRNVGHWMGKVRRMAAEFQSQFQEAMREAEMEDLKKHADDLNNAARSLTKPLDPTDYLGTLDTPSTGASPAPVGTPEHATAETVPANTAAAETSPTPAAEPQPAQPTNEREAIAPGAAEAGGRSA
jgi:sec-independent protein translocase protein TatB